MTRHTDEPVHCVYEVVELHKIDVEPGREEQHLDVYATSLDVPCGFTKSEIGDLKFALRAQRNRVQRALRKVDAEACPHCQNNLAKLDRCISLLTKLAEEEKLCLRPKKDATES